MIVSVNFGFLYTAIFQFVWVLLMMVMSRRFIWLSTSDSAVNVCCGCIMLKSFSKL